MSALRGVCLLTVMGLGFMAASARAEDFEAGKSGAKIFESDCVTCHRSPRGLAKGMGSRALIDFLREHYTTGLGPANELATYLESGTADGDDRRAPRSGGEKSRAGEHERSQTAAPSDADAEQPSSGRRRRHATSTPEPATTSEHDAAGPPAHKRHHAHTTEPTNDIEPPVQASPESDGQVTPDATPQSTRESRHKHQRSPRNVEPLQSAKQRPDMTPTGAAGPAGGASEPSQPGTGAGKEPASAAAHGGEPTPNASAHANREGPADAVEPGSYTAPAPSVSLHASQTGAAQGSEPPSTAARSGDQPAFSAPSP